MPQVIFENISVGGVAKKKLWLRRSRVGGMEESMMFLNRIVHILKSTDLLETSEKPHPLV